MGYGRFFSSIVSRRDFVNISKSGRRVVSDAFILQGCQGSVCQGKHFPGRFGITVTKKIGNAVVRSRVRRRLRAVIVDNLDICNEFGAYDYVVIARFLMATDISFSKLSRDFAESIKRFHRYRGKGRIIR
mgnify:CR=1 FL=1